MGLSDGLLSRWALQPLGGPLGFDEPEIGLRVGFDELEAVRPQDGRPLKRGRRTIPVFGGKSGRLLDKRRGCCDNSPGCRSAGGSRGLGSDLAQEVAQPSEAPVVSRRRSPACAWS